MGAGLAIVGVFYLLGRARRRSRGWAIAYGAAALAILGLLFSVDPEPLFRIALVILAGALVDVADLVPGRRWRLVARPVAWSLAGGAVFLFTTSIVTDADLWQRIILPFWVIALGAATRSLDRSHLADTLSPLLAISVIGVWVTVPETDMVEVLLGLSLPMALVTMPPVNARATTPGLLLVASLLGWLTLDGAAGRDIEAVGGLLSAGVLLLAPLVRIWRPGIDRRWVFGVHVVFVIVATRLVDWLADMPAVLVALSTLVLVSGIALGMIASRGNTSNWRT